jgi:hypothetical protein
MITHLALLRFPQWMALSKVQRQFVWQHCVHPLLTRLPVLLAKTVLGFVFIGAAYWFGAFGSLVPSIIIMMAVIFLVPALLDVCVIARHRRDIEVYIRSHGSDIQSVA